MAKTYDPKNLKLFIGGIELSGFADEDTFITVSRNEDVDALEPVGIARDIMGTPMSKFKEQYECEFRMDSVPFSAATPEDSPFLAKIRKALG